MRDGRMEPFHACPHCGGKRFFDGPRGGASMNVTCRGCGAKYNLLLHPGVPVMLINELSGPRTTIEPGERQLDAINRWPDGSVRWCEARGTD